jgi:hypothetical protein
MPDEHSGHPSPETLALYVRGELGREPRHSLEAHLAACSTCQSAVDALPVPPGPVRWQAHRFAARRIAHERDEERRENVEGVLGALGPIIDAVSRSELSELLAADEHGRRALIRNEPRFRSLALCELLEAHCRSLWLDDPAAAVEPAKLAVLIAERMAADAGPEPPADARAMALMHLGNACRIAAEERRRPLSEVAEDGLSAFRPSIGEPGGSLWEAELALWELRDAFLARGLGFDAVLVCLDLAQLFLRQGRETELRRMAEESIPRFEKAGADPYVVDALRFLQDEKAREGRPLTPDLLEKMARVLQEARHDPRR